MTSTSPICPPSSITTIEEPTPALRDCVALSSGGAGTDSGLAQRAVPETLAIADQDGLLARVEARLAEEVLDLVTALLKFGRGAQAVGEELPLNAHFGKHITAFLSCLSLQLAYALLKGRDKPLLLDDGAQQLAEFGLHLHQFVREVDLDGRRFLAVALLDEQTAEVREGVCAG